MVGLGAVLFSVPGALAILMLAFAPLAILRREQQRAKKDAAHLARQLAIHERRRNKRNTKHIAVPAQRAVVHIVTKDDGNVATVTARHSVQRARRAMGLLDAWSALLPARVAREDLGDYIELIAERLEKGQNWLVYVNTAGAMFWTGVNAVGYFLKETGKRKTT